VRHVIEHCPVPLFSDERDDRELVVFLGPDAKGVPLEIVAIEIADGGFPVVHAMRLRARYREDYQHVTGQRP